MEPRSYQDEEILANCMELEQHAVTLFRRYDDEQTFPTIHLILAARAKILSHDKEKYKRFILEFIESAWDQLPTKEELRM